MVRLARRAAARVAGTLAVAAGFCAFGLCMLAMVLAEEGDERRA